MGLSKPPPYPYCDAPRCFRHGMYDGKCPEHRIAELEAERDQLLDKICADRDFHAKNRAKHTAMEEGLRELAEKWRELSYKTTDAYTNLHGCADELEALLGKESEDE